MGPGIIAGEFEVVEMEVEDGLDVGIDLHDWQGTGLAGELQSCLIQMVQIEMSVASGMNEVTGFVTRHLSHHLQQQRIAGNIERNTKEGIGTALIELQRETSLL